MRNRKSKTAPVMQIEVEKKTERSLCGGGGGGGGGGYFSQKGL